MPAPRRKPSPTTPPPAGEEELRVEYMDLDAIKAAKRNPRRHAVEAIQGSYGRFGYNDPPTIDERTGRLVAGHGRIEALTKLREAGAEPPKRIKVAADGGWLIPVLRGVSFANGREAEAYLLANNRMTELAEWDGGGLRDILKDMDDLLGTGFDREYLDNLVEDLDGHIDVLGDDDSLLVPKNPKTKLGDLYVLGDHRLVCGDSTDPAVMTRALDGQLAELCWTDPPWNVAIGTHQAYGDKKKYRPIKNDDLGDAFPEFARNFARAFAGSLQPGGLCYVAMSTQEWPVVDAAMRAAGMHWSSTIIWVKDALILSQKDYHTRYEPIWYGWLGTAPRLHPVRDRKQSDVWEIPRPRRSDEHPTMKPIALVAKSVQHSSRKGALVVDHFGGSGTTIIAAEQVERRAALVELDPAYCDVIVDRWEKLSGKKAERHR